MMTWALSLVAIIAMSERTLLTSHARCWIVGSLVQRVDGACFLLPPACLLAFGVASCSPRG